MGDAARQLADGFHFLRLAQGIFDLFAFQHSLFDALLQRLIEFADRFFGFLSGGHVDGGADHTDHFAVVINHRCLGR